MAMDCVTRHALSESYGVKLAILTQYYPPETGAPQNRLSDLAVRLAARGHEIQVLTALPNYPGKVVHPEYVGRENTVEWLDGVRVARVGLYVPHEKTFVNRLRCYLSFARNARRMGARLLRRTDVLLMESPPLFIAWAGTHISRRLGARLVTNVADLWPESAVEIGMLRAGPALWAARWLESWMYRRSALITAQTEGIVDDIRRRFSTARVVLFPNGVDLAVYDMPLDREGIRTEFNWDNSLFVIGYTGVLGHSQALHQILDAALLLRDENGIEFALFGDGPVRDELETRIMQEDIRSVVIYPHQPRERMPHIQAALDAGIVPLAKGRLLEGARPSKMFEIMATGKPVILCARGEAERLLHLGEDGPAGLAVPPEDPPALACCVRELKLQKETATAMGRRGKELVRKHFDREQISYELERVLLTMIHGTTNRKTV